MRLSNKAKVYIAITLISAAEGLSGLLVPSYLRSTGLPAPEIGFIMAAFGIASLLSRMPAGFLYRPGWVKPMAYTLLVVLGSSIALYPLVGNPVLFSLVRAFNGLGYGAIATLNLALFMDSLPPEANRVRDLSIYLTMFSAGYGLGSFVTGFLVDTFGFQVSFFIAASLVFLALPITNEIAPSFRRVKERKPRPKLSSVKLSSVWTSLWLKLGYIRNPSILLATLLNFTLFFMQEVVNTFFPLYALNVGLSLTSVGFLKATQSAANTITRPFADLSRRWLNFDDLVNVGLVLNVVVVAFVTFSASFVFLVILFAVIGLLRALLIVGNYNGLMQGIDDDAAGRGAASGIFNAGRDLGVVAGPVVGGLLVSAVGLDNTLRIGPAAVVIVYFVSLVALRAQRREAARVRSERA